MKHGLSWGNKKDISFPLSVFNPCFIRGSKPYGDHPTNIHTLPPDRQLTNS